MVYLQRLALILCLGGLLPLFAQTPDDAPGAMQAPEITVSDSLELYTEPDSLDLDLPEDLESTEYGAGQQLGEEADPFADIDREHVIQHIDLLRQVDFPNAVTFDQFSYPNLGNIYRMGFDFAGLQNEPSYLRAHGFELPASYFQSWLYLGYLSQFHQLESDGMSLDARHLAYEYPVSLARLQGSLGDYDSRYAQASFAKGDLFGFEGSAMQFDYKLFNGYWVDSANSGNSFKQYLAYRSGDLLFALDWASYQKEMGSYELDPSYWHLGNFMIKNSYRQVIGTVQHPWLSLSVASLRDRNSSNTFSQTWQTDALMLAAESRHQVLAGEGLLRYEYRDVERNYLSPRGYNRQGYQQLMRLGLMQQSWMNLDLEAELMDWESWRGLADLSRDLGSWRLGLYGRAYQRARDPLLQVTSPVDGGLTSNVDVFSPHEAAIYGQFTRGGLRLSLAWGQKREELDMPGGNYEEDLNLLRLAGAFDESFGAWRLRVDSSWNYQEFGSGPGMSPEYRFVSHQRLIRDMGHDNQVELGFGLQGHSDYLLTNIENSYPIEASTVLDAWGGLRISKLFDFNVTVKNILSTSIYGLYPIPLSIHANLRWFFIN